MTSQTPTVRLCIVCRQPLPQGSGFCVACGNMNEAALTERKVNLVGQADQRIGFAQRIGDWCRAFGSIFRRL